MAKKNKGSKKESSDKGDVKQLVAATKEKSLKKATFDMDIALHTELKVHAARQGRPMVDLMEEALRAYLKQF